MSYLVWRHHIFLTICLFHSTLIFRTQLEYIADHLLCLMHVVSLIFAIGRTGSQVSSIYSSTMSDTVGECTHIILGLL